MRATLLLHKHSCWACTRFSCTTRFTSTVMQYIDRVASCTHKSCSGIQSEEQLFFFDGQRIEQLLREPYVLPSADHASRAKTGEESARPDTLQDSPPRPSVQQFARMEATKQQAQLALQNAFGSSAELPDPASQPGRPGPANGNHPSAAGTAFAAPRASFPQPQVHNVNNGPHVPTTQQPGAGSATTAAATEPPPQLWHGPQQTRAPQPQASVPSSQLAPVAASAPAPRPGRLLLLVLTTLQCRQRARVWLLILVAKLVRTCDSTRTE